MPHRRPICEQQYSRLLSKLHGDQAMAAGSTDGELNPRTKVFEFGGPIGTFLLTILLPGIVLGQYILCTPENCSLRLNPALPKWQDFWYPLQIGFAVYVLWFVFHALIYLSPLGRTAESIILRDGTKLKYKINMLHAFIISHILFVVGYLYFKVPVTFIYDHILALATAVTLLCFLLSCYVYARSFRAGALLSVGGNSGNFIYDWFMGRELNPHIGMFDWKFFCELRPGMIGWAFIDYCMLAKQYEIYGYVTISMVLVCIFQFGYPFVASRGEAHTVTSMDITYDGFGFMMVFGNLAWLPFIYSFLAYYLVEHPTELSWWMAGTLVALCILGYYIFVQSNNQKAQFRRDPNHPAVKHLKTMPTERGTRLIISGWWGICRHPNYVGDIIIAFCMALPCGFNHFLPYFYPISLTLLLIHRQFRDEDQCRRKYGKDWDKYCQIVRWRLIPYIY